MGRSVSMPGDAIDHCFFTFKGNEWDWNDLKEDIQETLKSNYPSLCNCSEWLDREDYAILENDLVHIGISEYCGLVCLWIVAKEDDYEETWRSNFSQMFVDNVWPYVERTWGELKSLGHASNGEQFFESKNSKQNGPMGLGFTSKEGWL